MRDFNVYLEVDGRQVVRRVEEENRFDAAALAQVNAEIDDPAARVEVVSVSEVGRGAE